MSLWRIALAGLVIPALVSTGLAPSLHAHEADSHRSHTIVHRHVQMHAIVSSVDLHDVRIAVTEDSDHDVDAVWMDAQSVERSTVNVDNSSATLCRALSFVPAPKGLGLLVPPSDSLPHGPPAPSIGPRAPPTPAV